MVSLNVFNSVVSNDLDRETFCQKIPANGRKTGYFGAVMALEGIKAKV